jgi:hypothetical protein
VEFTFKLAAVTK